MKPSFHEDFSRKDEVRGSSDRGFGLTVGGILLAIAAVRAGLHLWDGTDPGWIEGALAGVGLLLLVFGLLAPARLAPLNRAWTRLGLILFKVVNPLVLGLTYVARPCRSGCHRVDDGPGRRPGRADSGQRRAPFIYTVF